MTDAIIIKPVEELEWISPMVMQDKKMGEIHICVDLRNLNDVSLHDPFPTLFIDEVLKGAEGEEIYLFTDKLSGYQQIRIVKEDRHKTNFITQWGCFQYTVMLFGLKNAPTIFSKIVVADFKDFIHKFLEFYIDDWTIYGLVKYHTTNLYLMLERCR